MVKFLPSTTWEAAKPTPIVSDVNPVSPVPVPVIAVPVVAEVPVIAVPVVAEVPVIAVPVVAEVPVIAVPVVAEVPVIAVPVVAEVPEVPVVAPKPTVRRYIPLRLR